MAFPGRTLFRTVKKSVDKNICSERAVAGEGGIRRKYLKKVNMAFSGQWDDVRYLSPHFSVISKLSMLNMHRVHNKTTLFLKKKIVLVCL